MGSEQNLQALRNKAARHLNNLEKALRKGNKAAAREHLAAAVAIRATARTTNHRPKDIRAFEKELDKEIDRKERALTRKLNKKEGSP